MNPVALLPSACNPFIPNTDLSVQLKIYGDADAMVSLSGTTEGLIPVRLGNAVVAGTTDNEYVNVVSFITCATT